MEGGSTGQTIQEEKKNQDSHKTQMIHRVTGEFPNNQVELFGELELSKINPFKVKPLSFM